MKSATIPEKLVGFNFLLLARHLDSLDLVEFCVVDIEFQVADVLIKLLAVRSLKVEILDLKLCLA